MADTATRPRERLIEMASRLFYTEGIRAVGVDRVISEAGVAKATLYAHFAGKEELVAAYLDRQSRQWSEAVETRLAAHPPGSTAWVLAPFDVLAERAARPGYRGCPFINAAAELPGPGPVADQLAAHRRRVRARFSDLVGTAVRDPGLVDVIVALYDGALAGAYLDRDPAVVAHARCGAERLLAGADPAGPAQS